MLREPVIFPFITNAGFLPFFNDILYHLAFLSPGTITPLTVLLYFILAALDFFAPPFAFIFI